MNYQAPFIFVHKSGPKLSVRELFEKLPELTEFCSIPEINQEWKELNFNFDKQEREYRVSRTYNVTPYALKKIGIEWAGQLPNISVRIKKSSIPMNKLPEQAYGDFSIVAGSDKLAKYITEKTGMVFCLADEKLQDKMGRIRNYILDKHELDDIDEESEEFIGTDTLVKEFEDLAKEFDYWDSMTHEKADAILARYNLTT
jgi:hypothetical protein